MTGKGREMNARRLTRAVLLEWLEGLRRQGTRVVAPVDEQGLRRFRPLDATEEACLDPGKTRWSPKEYLFPRTESLFAYAARDGGVELTAAKVDEAPQLLLGVRPCDAAGLCRLDAVFLGPEADPLYAHRRERTIVVSLACDRADPECFCTVVGGGPAGETGSDVQLLPVGEGWIVRSLTAKGEAVTASLGDRAPSPTPEEWAEAETRARSVIEAMHQSPLAREWAAVLEASFGQPLWEALGRRCLGCSICTYVCPSCSCFDVQDSGNAWCGDRCRSWDSCTFGLFTRHASGHNPRPTRAARYRQRVLHKFAYYPLEHAGEFMCVGCGRCVRLCPVGMNVRESVQRMVATAREGADAGG